MKEESIQDFFAVHFIIITCRFVAVFFLLLNTEHLKVFKTNSGLRKNPRTFSYKYGLLTKLVRSRWLASSFFWRVCGPRRSLGP